MVQNVGEGVVGTHSALRQQNAEVARTVVGRRVWAHAWEGPAGRRVAVPRRWGHRAECVAGRGGEVVGRQVQSHLSAVC